MSGKRKTIDEMAAEKEAKNAKIIDSASKENGIFIAALTGPNGSEMLKMLKEAYYDQPSYSSDAMRMAYNEGQRSVVAVMLNALKTNVGEDNV